MLDIPPDRLPKHVAIIMDGNRRWAKAHFLPRVEGHRRGVQAVRRTVEACLEFHIPYLTLYTFSAENWNRSEEEVSALMSLLAYHLRKEVDELEREGVRFRALGRIRQMPEQIRSLVAEMEAKTRHNSRLNFNIALNYGGRQELADAARQLIRDVQAGQLDPEAVTEEEIAKRLTTVGQPDPDLLIRTGGELRVSNFLLWQSAYTELIFLPIFWPEFDRNHLANALLEFSQRERRFGAAP